MLIKNGKVIIFEDNDVKVKQIDIKIKENKIDKIEERIEPEENEKVIDATNKVVMPGLINTHAHIAMSIFRGTFEGCDLYTWLNEKIWPIEAKLTREEVYNASMLSILEMISTGTTCVNDHYFFSKKIREATTCVNDHYFFSEEIRNALEKSKMRAMITRVLMDSDGEESSENRINEFIHLYETRNKEDNLISYSVAPHGLYTCSDNLLRISEQLARQYNLPIHTHFLESINEIEDIKNIHNAPAAKVLKKYFDGIPTILAHGVKINDEDIEILKTMQCGISHNPISNFRLGCKIADVTKYLKNGINVALGTDGQGSGNNLDMFETMKLAALGQGGIHEDEERITSKDVIKMATINGAKLLGIDNRVGSIEKGKEADLIIVDITPKLDNIKIIPNNDIISNLVYNINGNSVQTTIVNGNILMEDRKMKLIDENKIIEQFL